MRPTKSDGSPDYRFKDDGYQPYELPDPLDAADKAWVSVVGLGGGTTQWKYKHRKARGGARKCWATTKSGKRCGRVVMFGQRVCYFHGGATKKGAMAGSRRQATKEVRELVGRLGAPVEADPRAVLLEMVYSAYGMQLAIGALLNLYDASDMASDDPQVRMRLRSITNMYGYWSEKAAQFSALAVRAGIEERLVKLAESQAMTVVQVLRGALSVVKLEPEQERALLAAVADQLRAIMPPSVAQDGAKNATNGPVSAPIAQITG